MTPVFSSGVARGQEGPGVVKAKRYAVARPGEGASRRSNELSGRDYPSSSSAFAVLGPRMVMANQGRAPSLDTLLGRRTRVLRLLFTQVLPLALASGWHRATLFNHEQGLVIRTTRRLGTFVIRLRGFATERHIRKAIACFGDALTARTRCVTIDSRNSLTTPVFSDSCSCYGSN